MIEAVARNERRVLPVTSYLTDWLDIGDVCMSVPTIVGRDGAEVHLEVPVDAGEHAALRVSAAAIRQACVLAGM